jgi:predicted fused transcriptional regulator/phosphomethylpyrimidine kinase
MNSGCTKKHLRKDYHFGHVLSDITMNDPHRERSMVLDHMRAAVSRIVPSLDSRLIPENGLSMGYAVSGARDGNGIAALRGGIPLRNGQPGPPGPCVFGADAALGRALFTVMKFDPAMRCAAVLQYSGAAARALEGMMLECCSFDGTHTPPGISTMDWGIASCCKEGVPDAVIECAHDEMAGRIYLFGETPDDVANNIIILSDRIYHIAL